MNQQQTHDSGNGMFIEDTKSYSYIWKKLKNSIFDVLFVLLDNSQSQESIFGLVFQTGIDYLQMMAFPFNSAVIVVWNANNNLNGIINFFNNFNVSTFLPGISFDTFLVMLYALIFVIIVVLVDVVYVAYSFSKKRFRFTFPLIFMAKVVPLFVTVLFLPIMQTLLLVVNCQTSTDGVTQVLQSFPNVVCWEGWHLFHTTITLIFSSFFVFISCIVALALFEPRMTTNRLTARQNSNGEVIFIINKIICQFIFSFSPFEGSLPYCLLLFVLSGWLFHAYNVAQPCYNKDATKFFRICSSYYFWTNLMLLASSILSPFGFSDGLVIWICGVIFIGITIIFERKSNISTLFESSLKFKSGQQLQSHLKYVLQLHHNRTEDKNSYMLLLGYIQKHIQLCLEEDCPLKYNKSKFTSGKQQQEHSCKQLLKQLQKMFAYGIKKYPECTKLRLAFAFFYLQKQENKSKAYQNFMKAMDSDPSFGQQFIIYRFTKIISENYEQDKQNDDNDLIQLIRFDNHLTLCEEGMLISSRLHRQFWVQLKEQSPILNRLNLIGAKIIETSELVKQNYLQIIKISKDGASILQLQNNYALYLIFICNQVIQGKNLLQKLKKKLEIRKKKQQKDREKMLVNQQTQLRNTRDCLIICQIAGNQELQLSQCVIKQVNRQFLQLTKYQQDQLISKKLNMIMPLMFQNFHNTKICSFLSSIEKNSQQKYEKGEKNNHQNIQKKNQSTKCEQKYMDSQRTGYIRDSLGRIKRVKYFVHYSLHNNIFLAQMKLDQKNQSILICDNQGIIAQVNNIAICKFPKIDETLSIQDLFGSGIIQKVKNSNDKSLTIENNLQKIKNKRIFKQLTFQINIKMLQFSVSQGKNSLNNQSNKDIQKFFMPKVEQIKNTLIIVTILQKQAHETHRQQVNFLKITQSNEIKHQKVSKSLPRLNKIIQYFYQTQSNHEYNTKLLSNSKKVTKSVLQVSQSYMFGKAKPIQHSQINFTLYTDQQGHEKQIKTYRYTNCSLQRLYLDDLLVQQSDYDYEQKITDFQAQLSKQRLQRVDYQKRIKTAINTHINHPEIISLFFCAIIFVITYFSLYVLIFQNFKTQLVGKGIKQIMVIQNNIKDVQIVANALSQAIYTDSLSSSTIQALQNHTIMFTPPANISLLQFILSNNQQIDVDITNALIRIQANLLRFDQLKLNISIVDIAIAPMYLDNVLFSYTFNVIQKLLQTFQTELSQSLLSNQKELFVYFVSIGLIFIFTLFFITIWIYFSLKINKKIFGVLIWFLDIPFDYIKFAQKQCLSFIKKYRKISKNLNAMKIKELYEHIHNQQYVQQFKFKQIQQEKNANGINESKGKLIQKQKQQKTQTQKNRKLLTSRYRKLNLISHFNFKQLIKIFLFALLSIILIVFLVFNLQLNASKMTVVKASQAYMKQYIGIHKFVLLNKIQADKINDNQNWKMFSQTLLLSELTKNKQIIQLYLKDTKDYLQQNFNELSNKQSLGIIENLTNFQYSNTCLDFSSQNMSECQNVLKGRLKGGYSLFKQYIKQSLHYQSQFNMQQVQISLRSYLSKSLVSILIGMLQYQQNRIMSYDFILTIIFYINGTILLLLFILPWHFYLHRLNIKLNQTIQILNVVPMSLLPVYLKETRDFVHWIIIKSSQVQASENQ